MKWLLAGTWAALGLVWWRQETLEQATAEFIAAANKTLQTAVDGLGVQLENALNELAQRAGSMD